MTDFRCLPIETETVERFRTTGRDDRNNELRVRSPGPCERYDGINEIPEIVRGALVSVRAYAAEDQCLYDLGHVGDGTKVDEPLQRALTNKRTAYVNIHTAKPGCLLCRVERR